MAEKMREEKEARKKKQRVRPSQVGVVDYSNLDNVPKDANVSPSIPDSPTVKKMKLNMNSKK